MSIITISRGTYSGGKEIAEKVAKKMGYECVSREILLSASARFNVPEAKLVSAIHDAPSFFDRFSYGKEKYVAFIEKAFLERVQKGNVVYHGLAGHFFLRGISHGLKVRVIADIEDRIKREVLKKNISEEKARRILEKDDYERRRWALALYDIDTADPSLYDLVVHLRNLAVDDAVDMICNTVQLPRFQPTSESEQQMADLLLAARVRARIMEFWPDIKVKANSGLVKVSLKGPIEQEEDIKKEIGNRIRSIRKIKELIVCFEPLV